MGFGIWDLAYECTAAAPYNFGVRSVLFLRWRIISVTRTMRMMMMMMLMMDDDE